MQKDSPGGDKVGNWRRPSAAFFPMLRTYGPGKAVQSGEWKAPQVKRAE